MSPSHPGTADKMHAMPEAKALLTYHTISHLNGLPPITIFLFTCCVESNCKHPVDI